MDKDRFVADSQGPDAPVDPSHTHPEGQPVEQGIIKIKEGISEQSAQWEDQDERDQFKEKTETYLKKPSPEENTPE